MADEHVPPASDDFSEDDDDSENPKIQWELELLNIAGHDINQLENELDEARAKYRSTFSESAQKLKLLAKKWRKSIQKARPYYEARAECTKALGETHKAARQYQSAHDIYCAAKKTMTGAEEKTLLQLSSAIFSSEMQENLNRSTTRLMEAELVKRRSEGDHHTRARLFSEKEAKFHLIEKKNKRSVVKAKPYFELKAELEIKLQQLKQNVDDLQSGIHHAKVKYSDALKNLEAISEKVHQKRRDKLLLMFPREPGVGAETDRRAGNISTLNLDSCYPSPVCIDSDQVNSGDESTGDEVFSASLSGGDLGDQRSLTETSSASNMLSLQRVPSDLTDADSGINIENASCSFDTNPDEEQEDTITEFVTSSEYADFLTLSGNAISAKSSTSNSRCVSNESDLQYADDLEEVSEQLGGRCEESHSDGHENAEIDHKDDIHPSELRSELCEKPNEDRENKVGVIKGDMLLANSDGLQCDEELSKDENRETGSTNDDSSDVINTQDNETGTDSIEETTSVREADHDTVDSKNSNNDDIGVNGGYCIAKENDNLKLSDLDEETIIETTEDSFTEEIIPAPLNNISF